jgi:Flp pilus assembly protein TadD
VSLKDIPVLLRMAQQDAGAGNYAKARTEYRKILGLQPNNPDARDGLHKLDIIQKDQQ